jgi:hypothetical protein
MHGEGRIGDDALLMADPNPQENEKPPMGKHRVAELQYPARNPRPGVSVPLFPRSFGRWFSPAIPWASTPRNANERNWRASVHASGLGCQWLNNCRKRNARILGAAEKPA